MILSESHLKIIDQHSENKGIKYVTLILTLLGCLSQLYHHTVEYVEKDGRLSPSTQTPRSHQIRNLI